MLICFNAYLKIQNGDYITFQMLTSKTLYSYRYIYNIIHSCIAKASLQTLQIILYNYLCTVKPPLSRPPIYGHPSSIGQVVLQIHESNGADKKAKGHIQAVSRKAAQYIIAEIRQGKSLRAVEDYFKVAKWLTQTEITLYLCILSLMFHKSYASV